MAPVQNDWTPPPVNTYWWFLKGRNDPLTEELLWYGITHIPHWMETTPRDWLMWVGFRIYNSLIAAIEMSHSEEASQEWKRKRAYMCRMRCAVKGTLPIGTDSATSASQSTPVPD